MKAPITFFIGLFVLVLSAVQYLISFSAIRLIGIAVGLFFVIFGCFIGWTKNRGFTLILGHFAIVTGCLVSAYAVYQLPFFNSAPSLAEVFNLPLFWGMFTILGGYCMITHGYCRCCIRQHESK